MPGKKRSKGYWSESAMRRLRQQNLSSMPGLKPYMPWAI